jgi:hypothetical protein
MHPGDVCHVYVCVLIVCIQLYSEKNKDLLALDEEANAFAGWMREGAP